MRGSFKDVKEVVRILWAKVKGRRWAVNRNENTREIA